VLVSLAGLCATAPVLLCAAAAIRLTSPGPVFFRQQRIGRHGRPFRLVKLRTMAQGSAGPSITAPSDSRITPAGKWLRKSKLDELPELWNVLRGDMALVGPRPEVPEYVELDDPLWREVLVCRPGLTDPVTLQLRSEEDLLRRAPGDHERFYREVLLRYKLRCSADYLRTRTWRSDLAVLAATARAIVCPGASRRPSLEEVIATAEAEKVALSAS
jgi:lipopolysaccharide/colanic/teichoic acid biosynthesis glycosyltransferase